MKANIRRQAEALAQWMTDADGTKITEDGVFGYIDLIGWHQVAESIEELIELFESDYPADKYSGDSHADAEVQQWRSEIAGWKEEGVG